MKYLLIVALFYIPYSGYSQKDNTCPILELSDQFASNHLEGVNFRIPLVSDSVVSYYDARILNDSLCHTSLLSVSISKDFFICIGVKNSNNEVELVIKQSIQGREILAESGVYVPEIIGETKRIVIEGGFTVFLSKEGNIHSFSMDIDSKSLFTLTKYN